MVNTQCQYTDGNGIRCEQEALVRVVLNEEHPFDDRLLCLDHLASEIHVGMKYLEKL